MLNVLSNAYISIDSKTYKIINFTIYEADMKYKKKKRGVCGKITKQICKEQSKKQH